MIQPKGNAAPILVRPASEQDIDSVVGILQEAARWLESTGRPMWRDNELNSARLAEEVRAGSFILAETDGEAAGTLKLQPRDELFWPDICQEESFFVHRLAVRRVFAGKGVSAALLHFAVAKARGLGRRFLRLDCEEARAKLRRFYEQFGFRHHSNRQVGPYFVSRYEFEL